MQSGKTKSVKFRLLPQGENKAMKGQNAPVSIFNIQVAPTA